MKIRIENYDRKLFKLQGLSVTAEAFESSLHFKNERMGRNLGGVRKLLLDSQKRDLILEALYDILVSESSSTESKLQALKQLLLQSGSSSRFLAALKQGEKLQKILALLENSSNSAAARQLHSSLEGLLRQLAIEREGQEQLEKVMEQSVLTSLKTDHVPGWRMDQQLRML